MRLGQPGIAATVGLLRNERPEVRDAAKQSLRQELSRWRMIDPYEATNRVRKLADLIKSEMDQFAPPERDFAAELATEILLWPLQGETQDRLDIVRDCEDILRKSYEGRSQEESYAARDAEYDRLLNRLAAENVSTTPTTSPASATSDASDSPRLLPIDRLPEGVAFRAENPRPTVDGGNLPPVRVDVERGWDETQDDLDSSPYSTAPVRQRPTIERDIEGTPLATPEPSRVSIGDAPVARLSQPIRPQNSRPNELGSSSSNAPDTREDAEASHLPELSLAERERYRWWPHVDLMRHLHNRDREFAEECRRELENRGFTNSQISISYEVTDPDPAIRRAAVDKLTRHVAFDPKPWLKLLCEDRNVEVRAAAISFLATSTNPADRRYVAELMQVEQNAALRDRLNWR